MNYDLNPFEGLCFLYYEMAHAGGHFDDNKNELVKESTKFWVDQVDGINLEDTLKKSFTQWFSSPKSEDRIHFLINGLLPNLKNTLNEDEREKVTDHLWKIGTNDGDLENDEEDLYNLVVDILDV